MVLLCCSIIFSNCSEVYCGHCGKSEFINLAMSLSLRSTEHRPGHPQQVVSLPTWSNSRWACCALGASSIAMASQTFTLREVCRSLLVKGIGDLAPPTRFPRSKFKLRAFTQTKATSLLLGFEVKVPLGLDYRIGLATAIGIFNITFAKKNWENL